MKLIIEQEIINRALGLIYKGDRAAMDATRIFFGNSTCEPTVFEKSISQEEYNNLLSKMPKEIRWQDLVFYETEDGTTGSQALACVSGECEIVDINV